MRKIFNKTIGLFLAVLFAINIFPTEAFAAEDIPVLNYYSISEIDSLTRENTLSYDEYVEYLVNTGYTHSEVYDMIGEKPTARSTTEVRFSGVYMKTFTYQSVYKLQPRFDVGFEYSNGNPTPNRMVSVNAPRIYTGAGQQCSFAGNMFVELESGNSLYCSFYGPLYQTSNASFTFGGLLGVGESANISASFTYANNYIDAVDEFDRYYSATLDP